MNPARIDDALVALLACPTCRGALSQGIGGLDCARCRVVYPVDRGVPLLDPALAEPVPPEVA